MFAKKDQGSAQLRELHVEVKGTSNPEPRFFISRNERRYMEQRPNMWRLIMVTNALEEPEVAMYTKQQTEDKFNFSELSWEATEK